MSQDDEFSVSDDFPVDDFPRAGTWSVNKRLSTGLHFITEARGDGTSRYIHLNQRGENLYSSLEKEQLEQICARHNEGIREEEG